jgi:hypothetical protein
VFAREKDSGQIGAPQGKPSYHTRMYDYARAPKVCAAVFLLPFMALAALLATVLCVLAIRVRTITPVVYRFENAEENWAQYSAYFPVAEYQTPPQCCQVVQVSCHILL